MGGAFFLYHPGPLWRLLHDVPLFAVFPVFPSRDEVPWTRTHANHP